MTISLTDPFTIYHHSDGAGNVTALSDASQNVVARYEYDAYGRLVGKWGTLADVNRYRFSSKEVHQQSGLYYYGFRFYDPTLQRWLNQDPIGEAGGVNLFRFVGNSSINAFDPFGLSENALDNIDIFLSMNLSAREMMMLSYELQEVMAYRAYYYRYIYIAPSGRFGPRYLEGDDPREEDLAWRKGMWAMSMAGTQLSALDARLSLMLPNPASFIACNPVAAKSSWAANDTKNPPTVDRIRNVAQRGYDYAIQNPRVQGLNRMQLGKDAEVQATRWLRRWADRSSVELGPGGLQFQVRGVNSVPDVVFHPALQIFDFKLTPFAVRPTQTINFQGDFPGYNIEYIFGR
jgi:RHS repeat-associated protein